MYMIDGGNKMTLNQQMNQILNRGIKMTTTKKQYGVVLHSSGEGYVVRPMVEGRFHDSHNYRNAVAVKVYNNEKMAQKWADRLNTYAYA
jgi:hypothetical protein